MGVTYINPYRFAGFDPLSLSPALWLDASDTSTITASSGAVSQWDDKSGNARHVTQGTAARQPTTGSVTINGRNALSFDGGDDLSCSAAVNVTSVSVFVVAEQITNANNAGLVVLAPSSGSDFNNTNAFCVETGDGNQRLSVLKAFQNGGGVSTLSGSGATPLGVYVGVSNATSLTAYSQSASGTTATFSGTFGSCSSIIIGARYLSGVTTAKITGRIAEVVIYPSALATADLNKVGEYLASKWGLTWTSK